MSDAIQIEHMQKSYDGRPVLKDLTFQVRKGEIFALLGVNGAGKTTALECIEGLRRYEGGRVTVSGRVGIQLQSASLPPHIKTLEAVRLVAKWNRVVPAPSLLSALGIDELAGKQYFQLSTGQKRRLHLALALLGDPDILVLDEPTAGLDVEGRVRLHEHIRRLRAQGKTILLASHDMAEVESLCERIAILHCGKLAFVGTAEQLRAQLGKRYTLYITTRLGEEQISTSRIEDTLLEVLTAYRKKGIAVADIRIDRGSLEAYFIDLAGRGQV